MKLGILWECYLGFSHKKSLQEKKKNGIILIWQSKGNSVRITIQVVVNRIKVHLGKTQKFLIDLRLSYIYAALNKRIHRGYQKVLKDNRTCQIKIIFISEELHLLRLMHISPFLQERVQRFKQTSNLTKLASKICC